MGITLLMQIAVSVVIPNRLIFAPLVAADKALSAAGRRDVTGWLWQRAISPDENGPDQAPRKSALPISTPL